VASATAIDAASWKSWFPRPPVAAMVTGRIARGGYRVAKPITAPGALPRSRLSALYM
jgi:hypothetical protein